MIIRKYQEKDLQQMIDIWNEVVEAGIAFPQEDFLDPVSGKEFEEGKYIDINLIGIFGGKRCRLQKRRPLRAFD